MADFDLTQTDQQVQNILNDAQGAMGASAQTTLTTEYVMLKDTSGVYHKILKSSFTEAIRDVLAGLLVNNDKGTTINQIAAIASGDFGSITPANLASVLGGGLIQVLPDSLLNLNSLRSGTYQSSGKTLTNAPSGISTSVIIFHTNWIDGFWGIQFLLDTATKYLYYRVGFGSGYGDANWFKVSMIQM